MSSPVTTTDESTRHTWQQRAQSLGALLCVCVVVLISAFVASKITSNAFALNLITYGLLAGASLGLRRTPWFTHGWSEPRATTLDEANRHTVVWFSIPDLILIGATISAATSLIGFFLMDETNAKHTVSATDVAVFLIFAPLIGPIVEELVCRGVLFASMRRGFGFAVSAIVSSILFAVAHGTLYQAIPTFVFGLALAMVYEKSRQLRNPIIMHVTHNVVAVILAMIAPLHHLNAVVAIVGAVALWACAGAWINQAVKNKGSQV